MFEGGGVYDPEFVGFASRALEILGWENHDIPFRLVNDLNLSCLVCGTLGLGVVQNGS